MYCIHVKIGDKRSTVNEIESQLLVILDDVTKQPLQPPVGLLTTEPRSKWAHDYQTLLQHEPNRRNIELIEQALALICLDLEPIPISFNRKEFEGASESVHWAGLRVK